MRSFHGQAYLYATPNHGLQPIGVTYWSTTGNVGHYAVAYGFRHPNGMPDSRRVNTPHLPLTEDPAVLQAKLDAYAKARRLAPAPAYRCCRAATCQAAAGCRFATPHHDLQPGRSLCHDVQPYEQGGAPVWQELVPTSAAPAEGT